MTICWFYVPSSSSMILYAANDTHRPEKENLENKTGTDWPTGDWHTSWVAPRRSARNREGKS
jgi:hypothetical protein